MLKSTDQRTGGKSTHKGTTLAPGAHPHFWAGERYEPFLPGAWCRNPLPHTCRSEAGCGSRIPAGAHKRPTGCRHVATLRRTCGGAPAGRGGQGPGEREQATPNRNTSRGLCRAPRWQTGSPPPGSLDTETDTWAGGRSPEWWRQPAEPTSPYIFFFKSCLYFNLPSKTLYRCYSHFSPYYFHKFKIDKNNIFNINRHYFTGLLFFNPEKKCFSYRAPLIFWKEKITSKYLLTTN